MQGHVIKWANFFFARVGTISWYTSTLFSQSLLFFSVLIYSFRITAHNNNLLLPSLLSTIILNSGDGLILEKGQFAYSHIGL